MVLFRYGKARLLPVHEGFLKRQAWQKARQKPDKKARQKAWNRPLAITGLLPSAAA
jgi:hypothetical protein